MNTEQPCHGEAASREFYESLAGRDLHPHMVRGITYRNLVVSQAVGGGNGDVLEVGPGEGWLSGMLSRAGHRVTVIDVASSWLTRLTSPDLAGRVTAEMTRMPFADGSFDVVVASEVVEHIPDIGLALSEAARVLRPRGRLVITVPYRETLQFETCARCGEHYEINGHLHTFDEAGLEGHLRKAGFTPLSQFVGPTRFSREILRRAPIALCLPVLKTLDRMTFRSQRVSDTWILITACKE